MQKINLEFSDKNYSIYIDRGFLNKIPQLIYQSFQYRKVMIITDENVGELYLEAFKAAFSCEVSTYIIEAGEQSKSLSVAEKIFHHLSLENISRKDCIVALGGGVVGDLAGFVASTYLRGIDFVQVPTSLLAQVDSSVGGKVAVNIPLGKNLVGSFYQPKAVYIDCDVLKTLDKRELKSGMAEIIKYACIYDETLLSLLEKYDLDTIHEVLENIIKTCVIIKAEIVRIDEKESGLRMILNYGHTIGHGIEKYFNLKRFNHGESVAIGMMYMAYMDQNKIEYQRILKVLKRYELIEKPKFELDKIMSFIQNDKKSLGSHIQIIRLDAIGKAYIEKVTFTWLKEQIGDLYEKCTD